MKVLTLLLGLVACLLAAPCVLAQTPALGVTPAATRQASNLGPAITIKFPGGTVKEFVDAVKRAGGKLNVVLPKEAEDVPIPAISLEDVSAYTALTSIRFAAGEQGGHGFAVSRIGEGDGEDSGRTFVIQHSGTSRNSPFMGNPDTQVFSIRELVEPPIGLENNPAMVMGTETILNALRTASEMDQQSHMPPPEIMLHKESMLLIVRGTAQQVATVSAILTQLTRGLSEKRRDFTEGVRRLREVKRERFELDAEIAQSLAYLKSAEEEMARASDRLGKVEEESKAGGAVATESMAAKGEVSKAQLSRDNARSHGHLLEQRDALLRSREETGGMDASGAESPSVAAYDVRDLNPFFEDVLALARAIASISGSKGSVQVKAAQGDQQGTIIVRATPAEQRVLVQAFNLVRRAKANEPKLPGLDADELIRKGEAK